MQQGFFVTFEGGEGAGKTTLIEGLSKKLSDYGRLVLVTREPGGIPLGEKIREWLLSRDPSIKIGSKAEMLLFLASRLQHLEEKILPALNKGTVVLCDRFNDSTVAYQGLARGLGMDWVRQICDHLCGIHQPQLTFVLDLDPEEGLSRSTGDGDRIEDEALAFHKKVRKGFQEIAANDPTRVHLLDAHQPQEVVLNEAWKILREQV